MDDPEQWRWIWLAAAVVFGIGEMATPGAFFLGPFAIGAGVAAALAWAGVPLVVEWVAFVGVSLASFAALRPLARRLGDDGSEGIGSRRLIGRDGFVISEIVPGHPGMVRVDREEWRADSSASVPIAEGTPVRIISVEGTRLIVTPSKEHAS